MKNHLLLFLLLVLFIITPSYSQNYQGYVPFPTSGANWSESESGSSPTSNYHLCINNNYRFKGDTLINGLLYHEIEKTEIDQSSTNGCVPPWSAQTTISTFGYLRNDSANKKVWVRFPNQTTDSLFYDFNINVGDTLYKSMYDTFLVDSVDTVYLGNRSRKKFYFTSNNPCIQGYGFDYMIEGIGRNTGFAQRDYCPLAGHYTDLLCMGDSSGGVYPDSSTCGLITKLAEQEESLSSIQLHPNPTSGTVNLTFEKTIQSIEVYNLQGQKVQEINPKERSWQLPKESGLYLIRIQDQEGSVYMEKVIKN